MQKIKSWVLFLILGAFILSGCAPLVVGGAAVGAGTGTYFYVSGELKTDYHFSFDRVWDACEKTVADMNSTDVTPYKEIGKGTIDAVIDEEKVLFSIKYKAKNLTTVAIRVGIIGNQVASRRLHDKVTDHLLKK